MTDNASLIFDLSGSIIYSGNISGSGGTLTQEGGGTLILTGSDTYTGGTTISVGTLQIGNGGTTGSISNTGTVTDSTSLVFNRSNNLTYSGTISGNGTLTQKGGGILTLSGTNSYKGTTTLAAGELGVNSAGALNSTSSLIFTGGSLQYNTSNTLGDYSARIANSSSAISIDTNNKNVTYASALAASSSGRSDQVGQRHGDPQQRQ